VDPLTVLAACTTDAKPFVAVDAEGATFEVAHVVVAGGVNEKGLGPDPEPNPEKPPNFGEAGGSESAGKRGALGSPAKDKALLEAMVRFGKPRICRFTRTDSSAFWKPLPGSSTSSMSSPSSLLICLSAPLFMVDKAQTD
jgi:hypothetical protein